MSNEDIIRRIDTYCDEQPQERARIEELGPLVLFVPVRSGFPYYARPRLGQRAPLTADAVRAVRARQRELRLPESFEWIEQSAPDMAAAAKAAGLHVHPHPMLALGTLAPAPATPSTVSVRTVRPDDQDLVQAWAVPGVAFSYPGGEIGRPGVADRDKLVAGHDPAIIDVVRARLRSGRSVLATAAGPDGPLAAGSYQYVDGVAEITGVGVLPDSRRMGLGAAVTHALAAHALARGARIVFLSAADSDAARIYARLGFREIGTAMIAEPPGALPPDAVQLRRRMTGQGLALAGEVRLVRVPGASHAPGGTQLAGNCLTAPGCHSYDVVMDLKDATLMMLSESADQPAVAAIAKAAYERLADGEEVDYRLLDELIGEASGKGVLRAMHAKYSPAACDAIIGPILTEIGLRKPIRSQRLHRDTDQETDPLRATSWPPR